MRGDLEKWKIDCVAGMINESSLEKSTAYNCEIKVFLMIKTNRNFFYIYLIIFCFTKIF